MSSAMTGGQSALPSAAIDATSGAAITPRFGRSHPCDDSEVLRLWSSGPPLSIARRAAPGSDFIATTQRSGDSHRMHDLIESEVIPRLLLAHQQRVHDTLATVAVSGAIDAGQVERWSVLLIALDERDAWGYVDALLNHGHGVDVVFLELFAPAARRLGLMWEMDTCSFGDVTIGLLRLHGMLRKLSGSREIPSYPQRTDMRLLLSAYPGETHIFGVRMVAEFFRHAGWVVNDELQDSVQSLAARVASEWFAIIGLSMSADVCVTDITTLVTKLRNASCNRHVGVMVGGELFNRRPDLVCAVGADLTARDGISALAEAERWCEAVAVPHSMNPT